MAKPCPANWREMRGTDQVRHCTHCAKNVYNLSNISRHEAADLIKKTEGKVCVRYYARPDGGVMTKDCAHSFKKRVRFFSVLTSILSLIGLSSLAPAIQMSFVNRPSDPPLALMGEPIAFPPTSEKPAPRHSTHHPVVKAASKKENLTAKPLAKNHTKKKSKANKKLPL